MSGELLLPDAALMAISEIVKVKRHIDAYDRRL